MLDIGWQELALTGVVALLVLGPKELPGLMRTAGQLARKARVMANEFRHNIEFMDEESEGAGEAQVEDYRRRAARRAHRAEPLTEEAPPKVEEVKRDPAE